MPGGPLASWKVLPVTALPVAAAASDSEQPLAPLVLLAYLGYVVVAVFTFKLKLSAAVTRSLEACSLPVMSG